jgi:anti-sigma factor RsiW
MGKKCQDFIKDLSDYIDGELDSELCDAIEKHIGECENCRIMVDTLDQTVKLCREGKQEVLPEELENKLNNALRERWNKKFKKKN